VEIHARVMGLLFDDSKDMSKSSKGLLDIKVPAKSRI
jgi:hypothetical protein